MLLGFRSVMASSAVQISSSVARTSRTVKGNRPTVSLAWLILVAVLLYLLVAEDHLDQLSALGLVQKQQAILNGAVQIPVQLVVSGNAEERGVVGVGGRAVQPQVRIKNQARLVVLLDLRCHQGGAAEVEVEQRIRPVFALVLQLGR